MTKDGKKVIENYDLNESINSVIEQTRPMKEGFVISGYVSVVKNIGRDDEQILSHNAPNVLTQDGRDAFHDAMYENQGAITQDSFSHIALSVDTNGSSTTSSSIDGEIVGNGLTRTDDGGDESTTSHTVTQNTTTVAHTFTATGVHTAVQLCGILDNSSGGVLGHENTFVPANLEVNDTLTVTWTITAG